MLNFIHTRRVAHDLLVLGVLGLETFFAWRASLMYVFILTGRVPTYELDIIRWLVFLAVGVFGFALATHRYAGIEAIRQHQRVRWHSLVGPFLAVLIVVTHDVAATVYTIGRLDSFGAYAAVVGMCGLAFLPFLVGFMSHAIAIGIEAENRQRDEQKVARWRAAAELRYWKRYYQAKDYTPEQPIEQPKMPVVSLEPANDDSFNINDVATWPRLKAVANGSGTNHTESTGAPHGEATFH